MRIFRGLLSSFFVLAVLAALASAQSKSLRSIQIDDMNRAVGPCADFFEYANGNWRANNPIPPSMVRWSRRWASGEANKDNLHSLLEEAVKVTSAPKGSTEQLIGDYYGACMDESRVNAQGLKPLQTLLKQVDDAQDLAALQRVLVDLHDLAVPVPFALTGSQDPHNPAYIMADISANGLSLPERNYYLGSEDRFKEAREKFVTHVSNMLVLAGATRPDADARAKTILAMETKFAEASLDPATARDPNLLDHKTTFAQLETMAPHIRWSDYLEHVKLPKDVVLNVQEPKFLQEVDRQMSQTPLADWKTYLRWQLLNSAANSLPTEFVTEHFSFYGQYLSGAREMKPRWKRCAESADRLLGEALGRKYAEKYFPPEAKARTQEMVKNLLAAMADDIRQLPWMGEDTKKKALAKIATFNPKVGYPDKWKDYSSVDIRRDDLWGSEVSARRFGVNDDRKTIGKPVDRGRWDMTPPTSDAYYNPLLNEIVFPAGILQPPAFSLDVVDAVNYGAIGVVIGHEISHGFDDEGARYDEQGRLQNWWTAEDLKKFETRSACVADQFDNYFIEPGVHHNGKLVLGESIGDLGGAKIAYMAYMKSLAGKPRPTDFDGFTPEQQFFIAWGQFRGDAIRIETQRMMVQNDPHPIAKYRVNGPLSNLPEFQKAFHCKAESAMVRPAEKRCDVW